jgi:RNA polymerase-binding transcription factor DksA
VSDHEPVPSVPAPPAPDGAARLAEERDRELAVVERIAGDLADADAALTRLEEGTYGLCEACGAALEDSQLEREPAARFCPSHRPQG